MTYPCQPESAYDLLWLYQKSLDGNKTAISSVRTSLLRFTVPGWGGPHFEGKRLKPDEVQSGMEFLKGISLEKLQDACSVQESVFTKLNADSNSRRQARCNLKKFVDWAIAQGHLKPPLTIPLSFIGFERREGKPKTIGRKGGSTIVQTDKTIQPMLWGRLRGILSMMRSLRTSKT
jgi:hypothetical protein